MSLEQTQQSTQSDQGISASSLTSIDSETPKAMQTVGNLEQAQPVNPLFEESTNDVATNEAVSDSSLIHLYADQLQATPMGNYRKRRDPVKFAETKESVLVHGILQNIVIREADANGEAVYEVVAGYGRWQIAQDILAEQNVRIKIPCLNKGKISDSEALAIALDENNKRSDDSISERAELAKEYIGLEGGDIATAALKLNVSESIFRELLQLTNCCSELLDALDAQESPVKKGHCIALSQVDEKIQKDTLQSIVNDPSTYTVKYVKERLKNIEISLNKAKFDQTECGSCQFNSGGAYCFMFSDEEDKKCSNPTCYTTKSKEWLEQVRMKELTEKYGTVIVSSIKPETQVRPVVADFLGENQLKDCADCTSCVVYLYDSAKEGKFGDAMRNICVDLDCHTKLSKAHKDAMNPPVEKKGKSNASKGSVSSESAEDTAAILARAAANKRQPVSPKADKGTSSDKTQPLNTESSTESNTNSQTKSAPKSEAKLSKRIQRTYANMIQKSVTATVTADQSFGLAVVVKSIDSNLRKPKLGKESITSLTKKTPEELNQLIFSTIGDFCNQFVQLDSESTDKNGFNANKVLRESFGYIMENNADDPRDLAGLEEAKKAVIIESWTPSKDLLEIFTTTQLGHIADDSGFEQAYNEIHKSETAWATYINKHRKDEVIAEILKTSFDWSGFAPKNYIELGLSYSAPL